ncbi:hypothetical protein MAR_029963, partial [Mya arenaria]
MAATCPSPNLERQKKVLKRQNKCEIPRLLLYSMLPMPVWIGFSLAIGSMLGIRRVWQGIVYYWAMSGFGAVTFRLICYHPFIMNTMVPKGKWNAWVEDQIIIDKPYTTIWTNFKNRFSNTVSDSSVMFNVIYCKMFVMLFDYN